MAKPYEYWCLGNCSHDVSPPLSGGTILMGGGTDAAAAFKQPAGLVISPCVPEP